MAEESTTVRDICPLIWLPLSSQPLCAPELEEPADRRTGDGSRVLVNLRFDFASMHAPHTAKHVRVPCGWSNTCNIGGRRGELKQWQMGDVAESGSKQQFRGLGGRLRAMERCTANRPSCSRPSALIMLVLVLQCQVGLAVGRPAPSVRSATTGVVRLMLLQSVRPYCSHIPGSGVQQEGSGIRGAVARVVERIQLPIGAVVVGRG